MVSRVRLRLWADYFAATRNEVAVDEMFLALSKMTAARVGHWPRVPRWISLAMRHPYLTSTACRIVRIVWLAGGAALFFIREYLKLSRLQRSIGSVALSTADGAILGLSTRIGDIVKPTQFPLFPRTWLTLPWAPQQALPECAQDLPMLSILDRRDFRNAFADALIVTQRMRRNRRLSPWVLQTYTAFRWFLVRRAIDRISGTLVTAEHFDRWAVLADRSVRESRRVSGCRRRLIVVQHGALGALSQEERVSTSLLNLPTRLGQVDELHAYNSNEAAAFRDDVLATGEKLLHTRALDIHFFKPCIELVGERISNRTRVLFVGHPLCESFQVEVFQKLKGRSNFEVYYKPHPMAPMSTTIATIGWTIIENPTTFPWVDLLVSYPSTLVFEYEGIGIPASVHPLDASNNAVPSFIEQTLQMIE